MNVYNTYAKAKIDNPNSSIVGSGCYFTSIDDASIPEIYNVCNPADHCSTVDEFLDAGYEFVDGDLYIGMFGWVCEVGIVTSNEEANDRSDDDCKRYVLRAEALNGGSKIPDQLGDEEAIKACENAQEQKSKPVEWPCDDRIDAIGQNGNDGEHYQEQWNGEGLPVIEIDYLGHTQYEKTSNTNKFRPIKTPEQLEQEELEQLAYKMYSSANKEPIYKRLCEFFEEAPEFKRDQWLMAAKAAKDFYSKEGK